MLPWLGALDRAPQSALEPNTWTPGAGAYRDNFTTIPHSIQVLIVTADVVAPPAVGVV